MQGPHRGRRPRRGPRRLRRARPRAGAAEHPRRGGGGPAARERRGLRILEVGHPKVIAAAIERDVYHVLHLSCRGGPGTARARGRRGQGRSHHGEGSHRAHPAPGPTAAVGVPEAPATAACRGSRRRVSRSRCSAPACPVWSPCRRRSADHYATQLARAFYQHLPRREPPLVSPRWPSAQGGRAGTAPGRPASKVLSPRRSRSTPPPRCTWRATRSRWRTSCFDKGAASRTAGVPRRGPGTARSSGSTT